jgi:hypothetical protein
MLRLRQANLRDVQSLKFDHQHGNPVRQRDIDEWFAVCGANPMAVLDSRKNGWTDARVVLDDADNILVMFGVQPHEDDPTGRTGMGWLVGTAKGQESARELHRLHKAFLKEMDQKYDTIWAATIYAEDDRWHKALGFKLMTTLDPNSVQGLPAHLAHPVYMYARSKS